MSGVAALRLNLTRSLYYLSTALISVIFSLVALELMSAVYFVFFSPHFYRPVYLRNEALADWQTEFEPWGAWHKPNASLVHQGAGFEVKYNSNSIGARDVERPSPGKPDSVMFVGDSFVEGFGVNDGDRLSNLFEQATGRAAINLAGC